ncbi:MAG: hypothetical protein IJW59_01925 [Clostridia bacterium]|nr:hypothetical protein [Clostridia bacterium]
MNNYKFEESVTDCVVESCLKDEQAEIFDKVVDSIVSVRGLVDDIVLRNNVVACGPQTKREGMFVVDRLNAFEKDEVESLLCNCRSLSVSLYGVEFEIESLKIQLEKAVKDMDIAKAVKINDNLSQLNATYNQYKLECEKINQYVEDKQNCYMEKFNKFVSYLSENEFDYSACVKQFGEVVVVDFVRERLHNIVREFVLGLSKEDKERFLKNDDLKNALGSEFSYLIEEV